MIEAILKAHTYTSNRQRTGARTYPKASSGFRPTEHAHDPAHGHELAYHYPMQGKPGPAHRNPTSGRPSIRAGTDRIMAWRNRADTHYNIGVSHHDPTRPIPPTSRNHPFSHAPPKKGNPIKVGALKAKSAIKGLFKKKHWFRTPEAICSPSLCCNVSVYYFNKWMIHVVLQFPNGLLGSSK